MSGEQQDPPVRRTLADVFDWRANGLNSVRLGLAAGVIIWHSYPLTGNVIESRPLAQVMEAGFVDAFFAASGFLIVNSWMRRPDWLRYLLARVLRIMPAFWSCLIFTAFVLAPVMVAITGRVPEEMWPSSAYYVLRNSSLWIGQWGIAGTPEGVPYPDVWNGSLWTLRWEFLCYLGVMALGVAGILRRRWAIPAAFLVALAASLAITLAGVESGWPVISARFAVMFAAGALMYQLADVIPVNRWYVGLAVVLFVASAWLPNYRIVAALPVAYLVVVLGGVLRHPRFRLRNDISYGVYVYAFPVQQSLALLGVAALGPAVFAAATVPPTLILAAGSWWLVEKPAMQGRDRVLRGVDWVLRGGRPEPHSEPESSGQAPA